MIAALTISLGWWLVPALITVWMLLWAHLEERQVGGRYVLSGLSYFLVMVPILAAWCFYLALCLWFS